LRVQIAQLAGEEVAECGLLRRQPGGVEPQPRAGEPGEGFEFVGIIPDEAEKVADLVDQPGGGRAAAPVFQRGEVGGRDFQSPCHVLLKNAAFGAQGAEFFAEGSQKKEALLFWKKEAKNFCEFGTWAMQNPGS